MRKLTVFFLLVFLFAGSYAQQPDRAELERRRNAMLKSIKETEDQLAAAKKDTRATMGQLRALQNKLQQRRNIIQNINQEIGHINRSIKSSGDEIVQLRSNLEVLKMRYAQSIRYAYKSRSSYDMLAFLFSADNFNDALRRIRYLRKYRDHRKEQAQQIRKTQDRLQSQIDLLNSEKAQKDVLLNTEETQKQTLEDEKAQVDKVVTQLKGREKELLTEITKKKKAADKLNKAVQDVIQKQIELAKKQAEEEERKRKAALAAQKAKEDEEERKRQAAAAAAKSNGNNNINNYANKPSGSNIVVNNGTATNIPPSSTSSGNTKPTATTTTPAKPDPKPKNTYNYPMTPEATALSNSFASNKGKLPWPVEKGFIAVGFGKYKHPIAEKVEMENYGVDIGTSPGATARAVFEGTVTSVLYIPGKEWNVIVSHGHFFTVYSQLSEVSVKKGQAVSTKQVIGKVDINSDGESFINFQIWSGANRVDPAYWIAK